MKQVLFTLRMLYFRNPTPPVDYETVIDFNWLPVNDTAHINYLDINGNFTLLEDPEGKRVRFWDDLYHSNAAASTATTPTS